MKRKLQSSPPTIKSVDDLPLFAAADQRQAEADRAKGTVLGNSEPIMAVLTVKDHELVDMRRVIEGGGGGLQPVGERVLVKVDTLLALIELLTGQGGHG